MKVIELLNKIANDEEVPKRIKVLFNKFYYDDLNHKYKNNEYGCDDLLEHLDFYKGTVLNNDIEILEDIPEVVPKENKKIEDTARFQYSQIPPWFDTKEVIRVVNENFERHQRALNEIIDKINGE